MLNHHAMDFILLPIVATMVPMIFCNVEEAIVLLAQYNIHSDIDYAHHLAISDSVGRSVGGGVVFNIAKKKRAF